MPQAASGSCLGAAREGRRFGLSPERVALPLVCAMLAVGCGGSRPSLMLITLEGVGAKDLRPDGNGQTFLPALSRLAARGWIASCAITPSPEAAAAAGSLMTGLPVYRHGLSDNVLGRVKNDVPLLAERLRKEGFSTAAFIGSRSIGWECGLARGFERFDEAASESILITDSSALIGGRGWDPSRRWRDPVEVAQEVLRWLRDKDRSFTWVHLAVKPGEPLAGQEKKQEEAAVRAPLMAVDNGIKVLLQGLEDQGRSSSMLVVIVGTSGFGWGAHGEWTSGLGLYDKTIMVPLVITGPGCSPASPPAGLSAPPRDSPPPREGSAAPLSTMCVANILRRAARLPDGDAVLMGEAVSVTLVPHADYGWRPRAALRTSDWLYIDGEQPELYEVARDTLQQNNLGASRDETVRTLASKLAALHPFGVGESTWGRASNSSHPAPEEQRKLIALLVHAGAEAAANQPKEAEKGLLDALSLDPVNPAVLGMLARLRYVSGAKKTDDRDGGKHAPDALETRAADDPYLAIAAARLASALREPERAAAILKRAVEGPRALPRLRIALSEALAARNAHDQAADALKVLADAEAADPRLQERLGDLYISAGNAYRAAQSYERVVGLGLKIPSVLMKLGDCRLRLHDAGSALELFRDASRMDPRLLSAHLKQGDALVSLNKIDEALEEYRKSMSQTTGGFEEGMQIAERLTANGLDLAAMLIYQDLAHMEPRRFEPHYRIGEILLRKGRLEEAKGAFEYALGLSPERALIHYQLARVALARKEQAEALRQVQLLVKTGTLPLIRQASVDPAFASLPESSEIHTTLASAAAHPGPAHREATRPAETQGRSGR